MIHSPPYAALRAFEAVGRLRGIRRAAEALRTSHAAVSRHLNGLEAQLGVTLFDRQARQLTDAGKVYHERIGAALAEILAATQAVATANAGQLRIVCAPGLALHWLTARLSRFGEARGAPLLVDLEASDTAPDFADGDIDGDIRYLPETELSRRSPGVRHIELARPPVFPVASPDVAARFDKQLETLADLLRLPLIEERDSSEWSRWFSIQGLSDAVIPRVARYGHAHLAIAAARAGQGVALANPFLVTDDLDTGRLVRLRSTSQEWAPARLGAYIFRSSNSKWDEPRVSRFRRWLLQEFAQAGGTPPAEALA